jgi:hypothetical protein
MVHLEGSGTGWGPRIFGANSWARATTFGFGGSREPDAISRRQISNSPMKRSGGGTAAPFGFEKEGAKDPKTFA